jgi:hypothetical protein
MLRIYELIAAIFLLYVTSPSLRKVVTQAKLVERSCWPKQSQSFTDSTHYWRGHVGNDPSFICDKNVFKLILWHKNTHCSSLFVKDKVRCTAPVTESIYCCDIFVSYYLIWVKSYRRVVTGDLDRYYDHD